MSLPGVQTTTSPDGASLGVTLHGAQVLSWVPSSGGPDRIWVSPQAAPPLLRGGVPVVFPQFAERGPLPKHGFARDRGWELISCAGGRALLELRDDDATRALWPHRFSLTFSAEVLAERLEMDLVCTNTGDEPFTFTAALHNYLTVDDAASVVIEGVGGHRRQDNADGGAEAVLPDGPFAVDPPVDLAVLGTVGDSRAVVLRGGAGGDLVLTAGGFGDAVLWNPGPDQALSDVPPGDEQGFFCLEAAALAPVTLEPGKTWRGSMRLTAIAAGAVVDDVRDPNNA